MLLFKRTHWKLNLTDISSTWLAIREYRVGFPGFLLVNSALSRFFCKNDSLIKLENFSNYKRIDHIWTKCDHTLLFTNHKSTLLQFWYIYKAENVGRVEKAVEKENLLITPNFQFFQK